MVLGPQTYKGRISFLPARPYNMTRSRTETLVIDREPEYNTAGSSSRARSASMPSKALRSSTDKNTRQSTDNADSDSTSSSTDDRQGAGDTDTPSSPQKLSPAETTAKSNGVNPSDKDNNTCVDLPPSDQPVPSEWVTIEGSFVTIVAAYQTHLGDDTMIAPTATFSDGLIYLLIVRTPVTRMQLLNIVGQLETGAHVRNRAVELVAVKAFRLEPLESEGNLVVDGEKVKYGPIQGRVVPGAARIMATTEKSV